MSVLPPNHRENPGKKNREPCPRKHSPIRRGPPKVKRRETQGGNSPLVRKKREKGGRNKPPRGNPPVRKICPHRGNTNVKTQSVLKFLPIRRENLRIPSEGTPKSQQAPLKKDPNSFAHQFFFPQGPLWPKSFLPNLKF